MAESVPLLKAMAVALNVPVIVTYTLDHGRVEDTTIRPGYTNLPAALQLYSDVIVILHRPEQWVPQRAYGETLGDGQKGLEVVEFAIGYQKGGTHDIARLAFNTRWARFDTVLWDV